MVRIASFVNGTTTMWSNDKCQRYTLWFPSGKSRTTTKGPWAIAEVFGLPGKRGRKPKSSVKPDAIAVRLLEHFIHFGANCERVVMVTNASLNNEFSTLAQAFGTAKDISNLTGDSLVWFDRIRDAYSGYPPFVAVSKEKLFGFLSRFQIKPEVGKINDGDLYFRSELAERILKLSEIDMTVKEATKIGRELVQLVREKSHTTLPGIPSSADELRAKKGVLVGDVLRILSLSEEAYTTLRKSGSNAILALSRLQRLCEKSKVAPPLVPQICRFKAEWDAGTWPSAIISMRPMPRHSGATAMICFNSIQRVTFLSRIWSPAQNKSPMYTAQSSAPV